MPVIDNSTLATSIQALEDAIRYYDLLSQSDTIDSDDYEECKYMYQLELSKLCEIYENESKAGNVSVPLSKLLKNTK